MYLDSNILAEIILGLTAGAFVAAAVSSLTFRWFINPIIGTIIMIFILFAILSSNGFMRIEEIIYNLAGFLWNDHIIGVIAFALGTMIVFVARRQRSTRREDDRHQERMQRRDRPNAIL